MFSQKQHVYCNDYVLEFQAHNAIIIYKTIIIAILADGNETEPENKSELGVKIQTTKGKKNQAKIIQIKSNNT